MTATILNVGGGNQRLILTAEESGCDSRVQLSVLRWGDRRRHLQLCDHQPGQPGATLTDLMELDAAYSVDGFDLTSASNNISTVIDGLDITLKGEGRCHPERHARQRGDRTSRKISSTPTTMCSRPFATLREDELAVIRPCGAWSA